MVSRSVIDEDVELQVPSVDTDEASLDIIQNDSSHEMSITSESGDLSVPGVLIWLELHVIPVLNRTPLQQC